MEKLTTVISRAEVERQLDFCGKAAALTASWPEPPLACVVTYGCPLVRV